MNYDTTLGVPENIVSKGKELAAERLESGTWPEDGWYTIDPYWDLNLFTHKGRLIATVYSVIDGEPSTSHWQEVANFSKDGLGSLFDEVLRTIHTNRSTELYVSKGDKHYSIYVSYDLGGYNYWTYQTDARGYYLSVRPMEISFNEDGTIMTRSYMMFEGRKMLLEEAKRYSKKRLGQLVEDILRDPEHPLVRRLFEIVLEHEEKE